MKPGVRVYVCPSCSGPMAVCFQEAPRPPVGLCLTCGWAGGFPSPKRRDLPARRLGAQLRKIQWAPLQPDPEPKPNFWLTPSGEVLPPPLGSEALLTALGLIRKGAGRAGAALRTGLAWLKRSS